VANIFIKNGLVLTFDKNALSGEIIENGAIIIESDKIVG
jgi:hypothetical protein